MSRTQKLIQSFNAGELSPKMDARSDQEKYQLGCREMLNTFPLIYGGSEQRPGLEYINNCKNNDSKSRLVGFEYSVDDTFILEFSNQLIRFYRNGAVVNDGNGTEDLSALDNIVAHWELNDNNGTDVTDSDGGTHDGVATVDTSTLSTTGKVGSGCFNLDGQYTIEVADSNSLSFTDNSNDTPFSLSCWAFVLRQDGERVLMSKWKDAGSTQEWRLLLDASNKVQFQLADSSLSIVPSTVAHWLLNDDAATKTILDNTANNHDGLLQTSNSDALTAAGKVNAAIDLAAVGTDAIIITNDSDDLSFGNGTADFPFSIAGWVFYNASASDQVVLSKYDGTTGANAKEWRLRIENNGKLNFDIIDQSFGGRRGAYTQSALTTGWHFVVATYNGVGGDSAFSGITLYVDNIAVSITRYTTGSTYVAMENTATTVKIGALEGSGGTLIDHFSGLIDNIALFDIELSVTQLATLYNNGSGTENFAGVNELVSASSNLELGAGWNYITATYNAPADSTTAADGIILYVNGTVVDSTATNNASYVAMQNGAEEVRIGSQRNTGDTANEKFWLDKMDEVAIFSDVLTPTEVASLFVATPLEVVTPYLEADLFQLKFETSNDVTYITHGDYEERQLSRFSELLWTLTTLGIETGPFRNENSDSSKTITPSGTTGSITLTAVGHNPFIAGSEAGHEPSGFSDTDKSNTGALFKIVQPLTVSEVVASLDVSTLNEVSGTLEVAKNRKWFFESNGTWGGSFGAVEDGATVVLERSYDSGSTYETVASITSADNKNEAIQGTEETTKALYRVRVSEPRSGAADYGLFTLSIRETSHVGIVKITSVISSTVAEAIVLEELESTDATAAWAEGEWSNHRGWPIAVTISPEERLTFAGSKSKPLTTWGSESGIFTEFIKGTNDNDPLSLTLIGAGKQNTIRWILPKNSLVIGTVGGEHFLGGSTKTEALTPTNIQAKLQTSYGSNEVQAIRVGQAILFVQRGSRKIRELVFNFDTDSNIADDLTVFAEHVTESGIVDMDYQRTPEPEIWCTRTDGQLAVLAYERSQNVFAWSRMKSSTSSGDSIIESAAVIYGGEGNEDEVWISVKRTMAGVNSGNPVRYIERFKPRDWGTDKADAFFVDAGITYDSTATSTITGLDHLEGETVQVLADGVRFDDSVVASGQITLKLATVTTTASKVHVGLGYDAITEPMKITLDQFGLTYTKKITEGILSMFETIGGDWGRSLTKMHDIDYRSAEGTNGQLFG